MLREKTKTENKGRILIQHPVTIFFLAAALQGLLLAAVLGLHKRNSHANHILAAWIALLSFNLLGQIFYAEALYLQYPAFIGVTNFLPLTYGGFLWLYVRNLTLNTPITWRDLIHFAGFFFGIGLNLPYFWQDHAAKVQLVADIIAEHPPWSIYILSWLLPAYASVYAIYSCVFLRHYQMSNNIQAPRLRWLQIMLGANIIIWLAAWAPLLAPTTFMETGDQLIYLLVSLFIYTLGYFSLRQPDIFTPAREITPKYGENRLPDDLRAQIFSSLESHMREQSPWKESSLTLAQLAENTGIASHHISQVLNDHSGQSFTDYLNQYRVNAVCAQLRQANSQNLLDIAQSCGFSSKSSFNAIFKKHTGKTPSEYRKNVRS